MKGDCHNGASQRLPGSRPPPHSRTGGRHLQNVQIALTLDRTIYCVALLRLREFTQCAQCRPFAHGCHQGGVWSVLTDLNDCPNPFLDHLLLFLSYRFSLFNSGAAPSRGWVAGRLWNPPTPPPPPPAGWLAGAPGKRPKYFVHQCTASSHAWYGYGDGFARVGRGSNTFQEHPYLIILP